MSQLCTVRFIQVSSMQMKLIKKNLSKKSMQMKLFSVFQSFQSAEGGPMYLVQICVIWIMAPSGLTYVMLKAKQKDIGGTTL